MSSGDDAHGTSRTPDRRPIAARNLPVAASAAAWLARIGVTPNAVSVAGMVLGILAGVAFAATPIAGGWERALWLVAALAVQGRLLCNMLDGMVAGVLRTNSRLGDLYNEFPDRVSDLAGLIGLGYAIQSNVALGYLAGSLAVLVAYSRAAAKVAGAPQDYRGPMAKQQRMFIVTLASLYMGLMPASAKPVFMASGEGAPAAALAVICVGCVITVFRRLYRAARILRSQQTERH
jgi:phosphatidylglycerophosphate synthase